MPNSNSLEAVPIQNAIHPENEEAPGWTNGDASQSGPQQEAGALKDGDFSPDDLKAPSAGRGGKKGFESVFANDNRANPGFAPMQVAILSPNQFKMLPGRREVPVEMTNSINSDLTRLNRGWAIGINFTVVSRFEGGSHPVPNIPISNKDLNDERRLIAEDRKNEVAKQFWRDGRLRFRSGSAGTRGGRCGDIERLWFSRIVRSKIRALSRKKTGGSG